MAEGAGLLNRYTVKSRIGGSNPPLSATLISLCFFQYSGSVATPSGNKSTLIWGYLLVSFKSDFPYFSSRQTNGRMAR